MEDINNTTNTSNISSKIPPIQPSPESQIISPIIPVTAPLIQEPLPSSNNKNIIFYTICGIVILLLLTFCYLLAFKSEDILGLITKKNNNTTTASQSLTPTISTVKSLENLSPKETYLIMKAEQDNIKTPNESQAFLLKNGDKETVAFIEKEKQQTVPTPNNLKNEMNNFFADPPFLKEITDIQESINGDTTTLSIKSYRPENWDSVFLENQEDSIKIDNYYKDFKEAYNLKIENLSTEEVESFKEVDPYYKEAYSANSIGLKGGDITVDVYDRQGKYLGSHSNLIKDVQTEWYGYFYPNFLNEKKDLDIDIINGNYILKIKSNEPIECRLYDLIDDENQENDVFYKIDNINLKNNERFVINTDFINKNNNFYIEKEDGTKTEIKYKRTLNSTVTKNFKPELKLKGTVFLKLENKQWKLSGEFWEKTEN